MSYWNTDFQQVAIDKSFRNDLRKTIKIIEESKSQNEFQIHVGKLVGMVHFIANLKFQDEIAVDPNLAVPTANVEARHDDLCVPVRGGFPQSNG